MRRSTAGPGSRKRLGFAHSQRRFLSHAASSPSLPIDRLGQSSETGTPVSIDISCSTFADLKRPNDAEHTVEGEIESLLATSESDDPASDKRYFTLAWCSRSICSVFCISFLTHNYVVLWAN